MTSAAGQGVCSCARTPPPTRLCRRAPLQVILVLLDMPAASEAPVGHPINISDSKSSFPSPV